MRDNFQSPVGYLVLINNSARYADHDEISRV